MIRALLYMCLLASATGCILYSSDDDCDDDYGGAAEGASIASVSLLDPSTGTCVDVGYGGGGGGGVCGDRPAAQEGDHAEPAPAPDWATCQSSCTGLDESTCQAIPGCRAAFVSECEPDCDEGFQTFYECWAVAPSGPIQGGDCAGLDAYECSRHDDCAAGHRSYSMNAGDQDPGFVQTIGEFIRCLPEAQQQGCYSDEECGTGNSCNADEVCLPPPGCSPTAECDAVCYGYCVPDPIDHCYGEVSCDAMPPECPSGTRPGIYGECWSGSCIAVDECPEGTCSDQPTCDIQPPHCAEGSVPGVHPGGCYTGYCIPEGQCEDNPAPCGQLDEVACVGRSDCAPYYEGVDCTCVGDVCVCEEWQFTTCETH
jgi:hypothetical protein